MTVPKNGGHFMTTFRFVHTGDIHLDSPLRGLSGEDSVAAERIRTATRTAFANLIGSAIEEEVNFLIIAGDLYDGDWRDYQTDCFLPDRWAGWRRPIFRCFCSMAIMTLRARSPGA